MLRYISRVTETSSTSQSLYRQRVTHLESRNLPRTFHCYNRFGTVIQFHVSKPSHLFVLKNKSSDGWPYNTTPDNSLHLHQPEIKWLELFVWYNTELCIRVKLPPIQCTFLYLCQQKLNTLAVLWPESYRCKLTNKIRLFPYICQIFKSDTFLNQF